MKRKRLPLGLGFAALLIAFAATSYVYYLKQQTATLLAVRTKPKALERFERLQGAFVSPVPTQADGTTSQDWPPRIPDAKPAQTELVAPLKQAEAVYLRTYEMQSDGTWDALYADLFSRPVSSWKAADWDRLNTFLAEHGDLIAEIRAMAAGEGPLYPIDLTKGYATLLPHLAPTRLLARLLQADAIARGHAGDYAGAEADLLAGLRLAARLQEDPFIISRLVTLAINNIVYEGITGSFPVGRIPPDLAAELAAHFHSTRFSESFAESIEAEQDVGMEFLAQLMERGWQQGGDDLTDLFGTDASTGDGWAAYLYGSPLARPWQYLDLQAYAQIMAEFEATLELPFYEARPALDAIEHEVESLPFTRVFTRNMLPSMYGLHAAIAREQAREQILLLGAALESYANEHGAYPARLEEIAGEANGASIIDPFTGLPFHYVTRGDHLELYSEGIEATENDRRFHVTIGPGEIAWRGGRE